MASRRVHLRITGLVQGVSYRASTREVARRLGVRGWVRNLPNGDVEALAEAELEVLERFLAWTRQGPDGARVERVTVTDAPAHEPLSGFEVRR